LVEQISQGAVLVHISLSPWDLGWSERATSFFFTLPLANQNKMEYIMGMNNEQPEEI